MKIIFFLFSVSAFQKNNLKQKNNKKLLKKSKTF